MSRIAPIALLLPMSLCCAEDQDGKVYLTMGACAQSSVVREEAVVCSQRLALFGRTGFTCLFEGGGAPLFTSRPGDAALAYHFAPGSFVDPSVEDTDQEWTRAKGRAYAAAHDYLDRCSEFEFTGAKAR